MYNLNVSGPGGVSAGGSGMLLTLPLPQGENSTTPRTPEIVNSLIAMTNPFDSSYRAHAPRLASSPPGGSDNSTSSSDTLWYGAGSPGCVSPPSVQSTCSRLIKEGLKLTIQSKRRHTQLSEEPKVPRRDEVSGLGEFDDEDDDVSRDGLTPEDEERRRRRRERNKIAATKCRLKKRERTVNLVQESEILENQNHDLKSQIQELENQRRRLVDMLSVHRPICTKQQHFPAGDPSAAFPTYSRVTAESSNVFRRMNATTFPRPVSSLVDSTMTYRRVETCVEPYRRMETVMEETSYGRPPIESNIYHNFDSPEVKDTPLLTTFCRSGVNNMESTFNRIGDQYQCQNLTDLDQFVKPELPSMASFQSPASSFEQSPSVDVTNSVSPEYEGVTSPGLVHTVAYRQFEEENDTFGSEFSPPGISRSCIT